MALTVNKAEWKKKIHVTDSVFLGLRIVVVIIVSCFLPSTDFSPQTQGICNENIMKPAIHGIS